MSSSKKVLPRKKTTRASVAAAAPAIKRAVKAAAKPAAKAAKAVVRKPSTRGAIKEEEIQERERFIVLLRHGLAEEAVPDRPDEDRSLTAEGHARMKVIARGLSRVLPKVDAMYTSPLLRATQTAHWVSKAYRSRVAARTTDALTPGATTAEFLALVASLRERRTILVGHEPNLSHNLRAILGLEETEALELKKGGCYGVRLQSDGSATLEWLLPPRLLRRLGE